MAVSLKTNMNWKPDSEKHAILKTGRPERMSRLPWRGSWKPKMEKNQSSEQSFKGAILTWSCQHLIVTLEHTVQLQPNLTEDCRFLRRRLYSKYPKASCSPMLPLKPLFSCAAAKSQAFPQTFQAVKRSSELERTLAGQSSHAQLWCVLLSIGRRNVVP